MTIPRRLLPEIYRMAREMGFRERDVSGSFVTLSMKPLKTSEPTKEDKKE